MMGVCSQERGVCKDKNLAHRRSDSLPTSNAVVVFYALCSRSHKGFVRVHRASLLASPQVVLNLGPLHCTSTTKITRSDSVTQHQPPKTLDRLLGHRP